MGTIRYLGRHRNAGHGYRLHLRLRRAIAYRLAAWGGWRPGLLVTLGWLIDFDRHRFDDEYRELDDDPRGVWGDASPQ